MTRMKPFMLLPTVLILSSLGACALRPPSSSEEHMIDSVSLRPDLAQGVTSPPFCLHLRYHNQFLLAYSDTRTESWITDGSCASKGARRVVETIRLSWRHDWHDKQASRLCLQSDGCRINEQHVVAGRNIHCASTQARDGNQTAFVTTDHAACH